MNQGVPKAKEWDNILKGRYAKLGYVPYYIHLTAQIDSSLNRSEENWLNILSIENFVAPIKITHQYKMAVRPISARLRRTECNCSCDNFCRLQYSENNLASRIWSPDPWNNVNFELQKPLSIPTFIKQFCKSYLKTLFLKSCWVTIKFPF